MKKANKKLNKIKPTAKKPTKAVGKTKAMAPKAAKKPQTKAAKPTKAAAPAKSTLKQVTSAFSKMLKTVKGTPAKTAAPAKATAAPVKASKAEGSAKVLPAKVAKGTKAPVTPAAPVVAAVLTKPAKKVKAEGKGSKSKLTGAELAAHLERMCRENACENLATTKGYCRLDYIKNWKKIKRKEMILKEGKLNQYIEELVSKYPDKYIDVIRQDLSTEVNFTKVIHDLELDESIDDLDYDGDSIDSLIGSIKKEDGGGEDEF